MGTVYLVGSGPGDAGLLTVRGAELLSRAGAVVHDRRVHPAVLTHRRAGAELLPEPLPTLRLGRLLELAERHAHVVWLTWGDPFTDCRLIEEAEGLVDAGVTIEVVPGIPACTGVPAFAGVPLRGADSTSAFLSVVAAHGPPPPARVSSDSDVPARVTTVMEGTVADVRQAILQQVEEGAAAHLPAALIVNGASPRQRTSTGTLAALAVNGEREVEANAVLVIGAAVQRRERLAWFETRPLFGKRVVVTRPRAQAADFVTSLESLGAEVLQVPTIRIHPPPDTEPLHEAARQVDTFDWIIFTSVNGVARFWAALRDAGRDARSLAGVSVCAIGPATGAALELEGVHPDLIPERFVAEGVVDALVAETGVAGLRFLLPRAEVARSVLPAELRARGGEVVEVVAYRTVADAARAESLRGELSSGSIDLITFTSSSTVHNFVDMLGTQIGRAEVATIGPITSASAREHGLPVHVEAAEYTVPGLVRAIERHYREDRA
jgi:uroporphyrinogen III methyltransferase / synthase